MIPTLFGRATAVLGDHARLRVLLEQLEKLSDTPNKELDAGLPALISEFRRRLSEHFAAEEDDEYFGTLARAVPNLRPMIGGLCAEHVQFLEMARRLAELAEQDSKRGFRRELRVFLDSFNAHELAENVLLREFFSRSECG